MSNPVAPAEDTPQKPKLVPTTLMLDEDVLEWLGRVGQAADRSASYILRGLLRPIYEQSHAAERVASDAGNVRAGAA